MEKEENNYLPIWAQLRSTYGYANLEELQEFKKLAQKPLDRNSITTFENAASTESCDAGCTLSCTDFCQTARRVSSCTDSGTGTCTRTCTSVDESSMGNPRFLKAMMTKFFKEWGSNRNTDPRNDPRAKTTKYLRLG